MKIANTQWAIEPLESLNAPDPHDPAITIIYDALKS